MDDPRQQNGGELRRENGLEYQRACESFSWAHWRAELAGLPGGRGLNIAHEAVDRHVDAGLGRRIALRWLDATGTAREYSYDDLSRASHRCAQALNALGLQAGDRVALALPRRPELFVAVFGVLLTGGVVCPLYAGFGPRPLQTRLELSRARVLVTTVELWERKIAAVCAAIETVEHILLVGDAASARETAGVIDFADLLKRQTDERFECATDPQQPALLHFTSGTTGTPKGAVHVHEAVVAHHMTARVALGLRAGDRFWCTADPGWVTGISYGVIAPLTCGATVLVDEGEFDAQRWWRTLGGERVDVWYTAPTALRLMMRLAPEAPPGLDLSQLRHVASVGEPLDAGSVQWGRQAFGFPVRDTWWQTETGAIMIANLPAMEVEPGSMGRALPGIEAAVVERRRSRRSLRVVEEHDAVGELALRAPWPSMFRGYLDDEPLYRRSFADGWYLSGDLVRRDAKGCFWFVGRGDDVIQSAGHLVGPFEVENCLLQHPAVAEAAVVGRPDPLTGEAVTAVLTLERGYADDEGLRREILRYARQNLGSTVAPRTVEVVDDLPKTRSGKILRRQLRDGRA